MSRMFSRVNLDFYATLQKPASDKEQKLLSRAFVLSQTSLCRYKVGAILTQGNKIVCEAVNSYKTHPQQKLWADSAKCWKPKLPNTLHAELDCLIRAAKNIDLYKSTTLYVARAGLERAGNKYYCAMGSMPCRVCLPAILHANVSRVVCYDIDKQPISIDLRGKVK